MTETDLPTLDDYAHCTLCPRRCGANRLAGQTGFCRQTAELRIGAIVAHRGEEPCITGTHGSGTIFFTGCPCGCFFCQNHQLSQLNIGRVHDEDALHAEREQVADWINQILLHNLRNNIRFCAQCGAALPLHYKGRLCNACFRKIHAAAAGRRKR